LSIPCHLNPYKNSAVLSPKGQAIAIANSGIYRDHFHLWRQLIKLQENPRLAKTYAEILAAKQDIPLNPIDTYKLEGLGLIRFEGRANASYRVANSTAPIFQNSYRQLFDRVTVRHSLNQDQVLRRRSPT
jgi:hypothetical protein